MATRLERGLRIFVLLQQGVGYNAHELASKMEVSRRTIFRDMALLKEIGFPIAFDAESARYRYDRNANGNEVSSTTSAIEQTLITLGKAVRDGELSNPEEFANAIRRFANYLPEPMQEKVDEVIAEKTIESSNRANDRKIAGVTESTIQKIYEAIDGKLLVRMIRNLAPLSRPCFKVIPQRLILAADGWTLDCIVFESSGEGTSSMFALNEFDIVDLSKRTTLSVSSE